MTAYHPDYIQDTIDERTGPMSQHNKHDDAIQAALAKLMGTAAPAGETVTTSAGPGDSSIQPTNGLEVVEALREQMTDPHLDPYDADPDDFHQDTAGDPRDPLADVEREAAAWTEPTEAPAENDFDHPESCIHCEANIVFLSAGRGWATQRQGHWVKSCKASPTRQHEAPGRDGERRPTDDPVRSDRVLSVADAARAQAKEFGDRLSLSRAKIDAKNAAELKPTLADMAKAMVEAGQNAAELKPTLTPVAESEVKADWDATKKANFDRSVIELKAQLAGQEPEQRAFIENWPAQPMEADPEPEDDPENADITAYADRLQALREAREAEKAAKERADEARAELLQLIGTKPYATINGQRVAHVTMIEPKPRIDTTALRAAHPRIAKKFEKPQNPYARLDLL